MKKTVIGIISGLVILIGGTYYLSTTNDTHNDSPKTSEISSKDSSNENNGTTSEKSSKNEELKDSSSTDSKTTSSGSDSAENIATVVDANESFWLVGKWYSEEWNIEYNFEVNDNKWKVIDNEDKTIVSNGELKEEDDKLKITLKDKSTIIIIKKSDKELTLYQVAKEGMLGSTSQVSFVKKQ